MRNKNTRFILLVLLALSSIFFVLESDILPGLSAQRPARGILWIIQEVVKHIKEDYVEAADPSLTMEGAYKGLVNSLDENSSYLTKEGVARHQHQGDTDLQDVGIVLYKKYRTFSVVVGVHENSPAAEKGIKIGDTISALDGKSTLIMSMYEANLLLKDKTNEPIRIRILRASGNEEVNVERKRLFDKPFAYSEAEGTSGILSIHRFQSPCVEGIRSSLLPRLKTESLPLIVDLRNCHEGDFEEMLQFVNLFLQDTNIGYFEKKGGKKETLSCPSKPDLARLPLLIWTNQATIGPAEAAAAVLREHKKAKVIGYATPGLVAKHTFISLEDGSGLLLTSAIFYLNTKKTIWGEGLVPDIEMEGMDQSLSSFLKHTQSILSNS